MLSREGGFRLTPGFRDLVQLEVKVLGLEDGAPELVITISKRRRAALVEGDEPYSHSPLSSAF